MPERRFWFLCVESSRFEEFSSNFLECVFLKFMLNTFLYSSLSSTDSSPEWSIDICTRHREGPERLEKWEDRNLGKFTRGKYKIVELGRNTPKKQLRLGTYHWKTALQKRAWGPRWATYTWASNAPLQDRRPTASWLAGQGRGYFPSAQHWWDHLWSALSNPWLQSTQKGH